MNLVFRVFMQCQNIFTYLNLLLTFSINIVTSFFLSIEINKLKFQEILGRITFHLHWQVFENISVPILFLLTLYVM